MSAEGARPEPDAATPKQRRRGGGVAMWIALVVAGLLLVLSSFAVWINRVALNTGAFTDTSSDLLADDAIRSAVATRSVDELFNSVDVQAEIEAQLPKDFKSLSGAATAGLRQASYQIVDRALEQPALQKVFARTLEETHRTLVQVLEGGGTRVSTEGGEVTLDLRALILEAADRIGIGQQVVDKIPADAGRIVILRSDQLHTAQDVFQLLKTLAWLLPLLTIAAFAVAVWLAHDRRRGVRGIGIVLVAVGAVGLVAARLTRNYLVDNLVADRDTRRAANDAWDILTELMRSSFRWLIVVGLLFLVASWLAGPGRRAVASRRTLAPALHNRAWAYAGLAIVALILLLAGTANDFTHYLVVLVLVALGAVWIEVMRSQTLREFPGATVPTIIADARTRVSAWWEERRGAPPRAGPSTPGATDVTARLESLADLHARGELTDDEYASAKARVLAGG